MLSTEHQIGKQFASRLIRMVDTSLVTYLHTVPWADSIIKSMDSPPVWICELAMTKYQEHISSAIRSYLYSEDFTAKDTPEDSNDYHLACLYLRHSRGELSWATFLKSAGEFTDSANGQRPCEYFYERLSQLEIADFNESLELQQKEKVSRELSNSIDSVRIDYEPLLTAFRSRYKPDKG